MVQERILGSELAGPEAGALVSWFLQLFQRRPILDSRSGGMRAHSKLLKYLKSRMEKTYGWLEY